MKITQLYKAITALSILCGLFFAFTFPIQAQEKLLLWERFDVTIVVNPDGTLDITESQTIRFTRGTFTQGSRNIPMRYLDKIDSWSITDEQGTAYIQTSSGADQTFTVEQTRGQYQILWFFPPTQNESATYILNYKVHDALRFYEGGDQVWWKAIFGDRPFPVLAGEVQVMLADDVETGKIQEWAAYINEVDARDLASATLHENQREITFQLDQRLEAGEEFEVRVEFTNGFVTGQPQPWQISADVEAAQREAEATYQDQWGGIASLIFGVLGLLLALGGPALLYLLWYNRGRDKPVEMVADYLPEPPDKLPAGMVGTLLDERADMQDIIATLVDLAQRKVLTIAEKKVKSTRHMETDFLYTLDKKKQAAANLRPYEKHLIKALFAGRKKAHLSDLKEKFYTHLPSLKREMYDSVTEEGLFAVSPQDTRSQYLFLGVVLIGLGVLAGFILTRIFGDLTGAAILPAIGIGLTGIGLMILSNFMPRKTDEGSEVAARWRAFRAYLKNIDQYAEMESQKNIWDRWLPYAIAFGFEKEFIRKFESIDAPSPDWYRPSPYDYGPHGGGRRGTRRHGRGYGGVPPIVSSGPIAGEEGTRGTVSEGGTIGGDLSDMSRGMGQGLSSMSAGLGAMLSSAGTIMTSQPAPKSSNTSSGWSGSSGGGFSGGGRFGGGGGGGGGGGFS